MSGIGVNIRVTGHCSQGGRKYMEDMFSVAYQQTEDTKELEYAYFGIFDGHGGPEAAMYAKDHLVDSIVCQSSFWSNDDQDILRAIHNGYINTHYAMYKQHGMWPKTAAGLPSTSGTTATIAFIRKGKIYIGHVGDSCIVLGYQEKEESAWKARPLTKDHKPESSVENNRIRQSGGKVVSKSGVPRVVWNRPRLDHKGPIRRSTHIDEIPFLAIARALGDFWSYNSALDKFVVSPEPDVYVFHINVERDRCLILGTDGLWNMLSPNEAVSLVQASESHNENLIVNSAENLFTQYNKNWLNPSKNLVDKAIKQWSCVKQRADNTSVVTLLLDKPGPPRISTTTIPRLSADETTGINSAATVSTSDEKIIMNKLRKVSRTVQRRSSVPYSPDISNGMKIFNRSAQLRQKNIVTPSYMQDRHPISSCQSAPHQVSPNFPVCKIKKTDRVDDDIPLEINSSNCSVISNNNDEKSPIKVKSVAATAGDNEVNSRLYSRHIVENMELMPTSSPVKRKLSNCHVNKEGCCAVNSNNRPKLKMIRSADSGGSGSDIENKSCSWSETVCSSSSKNTIVPSNFKRKKFDSERRLAINGTARCSCSRSASYPCCDKVRRANKSKLFNETPTRILRSDTMAATPIKTLRSRNINLSANSTGTPKKNSDTKSTDSNELSKTINRRHNDFSITATSPSSADAQQHQSCPDSGTKNFVNHNRSLPFCATRKLAATLNRTIDLLNQRQKAEELIK